jgi:heptosyltransferase-1
MKIAIVKLSALGDIVHAMVALQFIKAYHADIQIDWIVEQSFLPILENNPDINAIYPVNLKVLKKDKSQFWSELKNIRKISKNNYDLVIDAQGLIKSAIVSKLIGKKVAGFNKNSIREKWAAYFYDLKIDCPYHENTIDRNAKILSASLGFAISSEQIHEKKVFLFFQDKNSELDNYFSKEKKNIIFVIGSTWESRNYPKEKFLEVAQQLQQQCLVVWGNAVEQEKAQWLVDNSKFIKMLPKLDLNDLKAAIAKADLVIGNDTGPSHLAWGLNKPSIILFGCTPVTRVYQTQTNKVLKSSSIVNPYKLNKQDYSIAEIEVFQVLSLAKQLLFNESCYDLFCSLKH